MNLDDIVSAIRLPEKTSSLIAPDRYPRVAENTANKIGVGPESSFDNRAHHLYRIHVRRRPREPGQCLLAAGAADNQHSRMSVAFEPVR